MNSCRVCAESKPKFYKANAGQLIKATMPFERLNVDFKRPLPSTNKNRYFLTVVDEYSRFPFIFPCSDMTSSTVIKCLCELFVLCGMPSYIHSDRGTAFMSQELCNFLTEKGVASSRTTSYNPSGNGQAEKYNDIIWRSVMMNLKTRGLPVQCWQCVLPDALHSVRSLLSTATNSIPHERFFAFTRRSTFGGSLPQWLCTPGPVLVKRFVREHKTDPLVDEVELLHSNPQYAFVRYPNGREATVSLKHLAPAGAPDMSELSKPIKEDEQSMDEGQCAADTAEDNECPPKLRRSERIRHPPERLVYGRCDS